MSIQTYDGALAGLTLSDGSWTFEGREYDTPATESDVLGTMGEALGDVDDEQIKAARKLVFGGTCQFTAQALNAMALAYEAECGDGEGVDPVVVILREAARRIAVIEALNV